MYKFIKTTFIKSDYHTNGLSETGKPYDEYKDESDYYIVTIAEKKFQQFDLKKKSIKTTFGSVSSRTDEFFAQHKNDITDEQFLKDLFNYLGQ